MITSGRPLFTYVLLDRVATVNYSNIMSHKEVDARTRFLKASAYKYASLVPATSAHLISQINTEGIGGESLPNKDSPTALCKFCGTISIPGWTSKLSIEEIQKPAKGQRPRSKSRRKQKGSVSRIKHVRIECLMCYRYVEKQLDQSARKENDPLRTITSSALEVPSSSTLTQQPSGASTHKTSGKKRAKARKQGGLQAMLDKSKASTGPSSGFGLDLLDMMKQG